MSGAYAFGLQRAVYARLTGDAELVGLVGGAIHDAPPEMAVAVRPEDYVTLGEETVRPFGTATSLGAIHDFDVNVHSTRDGFERAKQIASAICAALVDAPLGVEGGHLVGLRFLRARADRGPAPEKRRISLRFRAVVDQE